MTVREMLAGLHKAGLRDGVIGRMCGSSQANIFRIRNGDLADTSYQTGKLIEELFREYCGMAEGRIYKVTTFVTLTTGKQQQVRLVEAATQSQAVRHVVKEAVLVELASVRDAMALARQGIEVEDAMSEPEEAANGAG
jgi:hypothetical protein